MGVCSQKITKIFLVYLSVISSVLTRIPNSADMRGTYDAVVDNKKYLSPFHGFVWIESDLAEKYYRFGNAVLERGHMSGDATALLARQVFHATGAHFSVTGLENHPATYWKPKTIGQILAVLDEKSSYDERDKPIFVRKLLPIILERMPTVRVASAIDWDIAHLGRNIISWWDTTKQNPIFSGLAKNKQFFNFTVAQWKKSIKNVADLDRTGFERLFLRIEEVDKPTRHAKLNAIESLQGFARIFREIASRQEQNERPLGSANTSATILARILFDSLGECGHATGDVARKYPQYTTHCLLLAFLYEKARRFQDFTKYFTQFRPGILKDDADRVLRERFDERLRIEDLTGDLARYGDLEKYYEFIAYTQLQGAKQGLPPFGDYEGVTIKGVHFVDCGVNAMMNFIRVIMAILGLYDAKLQKYDFENIAVKTKAFLRSKGIRFDEAELDARQGPLIAFFQKFSNAGIVQGNEIHHALAELLSNLPGVKYLQNVPLDGSRAPEKNLALPSVHVLPGIEYGVHKAVDDSFYTTELAGYPSSVVAIVNHFFGFGVTTLPELFAVLGMVMSDVDPATLNDNDVYENFERKLREERQSYKMQLSFVLDGQKYFITLATTTAHAECSIDKTKSGLMASPFLNLALRGYLDGLVQRNLVSVYSYAVSGFDPYGKPSKYELPNRGKHVNIGALTPADKLGFFMSLNLFSQDTHEEVVKYLVRNNYLDPNTTLGALAFRIIKEITDAPVHDKIINNIFPSFESSRFSPEHHVLTSASVMLLTRLAEALNTQQGKKDAAKKLLEILYSHNVNALPDAENLTRPLCTLINSFLQLHPIHEQQDIVTRVLENAQHLYHHPVLHQTYLNSLFERPKDRYVIGSQVAALAKLGAIGVHDEKIAWMRKLIPNIFAEASGVDAYLGILEFDLTELYDAMNKRMLAPIDFPDDPQRHGKPRWWAFNPDAFFYEAKGLISAMLRKGKPHHQELRKFLETILPLFFSAPPPGRTIDEHFSAMRDVTKILVEEKFEQYYPFIEKLFRECSQSQNRYYEMPAQIIEILKYLMQQYATIKEESYKGLIERITPYFFEIALNVGLFPFDALVEVFDFTQEHPPVQLKNVIAVYVDRFREKAKKAFEDKKIEKEKYDVFLGRLISVTK